ncbi:MAG TPA: alpha/beta fold hydrolase, partial [Dehalococcoidia bacterium]|nr:alpha/beta fold hydrolase [Dehalococcoidia bacterium]
LSLAYSTVGQGPALVVPPPWISHQELAWQIPVYRRFWERLARHHTLVCYDRPGTGLSDRNRTDFSLDSELQDLETVIDHLKLKRLALLSYSWGGPIAVAYTAKYPRRISHLILYGTYARGAAVATDEVKASLISLVRAHWGIGSKAIAELFAAGVDTAGIELWAKFQRECATPEIAAKILDLTYKTDVTYLLPRLRVPTLVLHRQQERTMPFRSGRELASLIPNARFVPLEGREHLPWYGDSESVLRAIAEFLGDPVPVGRAVGPGQPAAPDLTAAVDDPVTREARSFIGALDWVALSRFRVVGDYTRYEETVRNTLKDVRHKIAAGFDCPSRKRENYLVWAAPGSGKTYFAQQVAASLAQTIHYQECNLAKYSRQEFLSGLARLDAVSKPCLCLIDEVDAKPDEAWPYEVLLPYLDANTDKGAQFVFVLAGSSGSSVVEMKKRIALRPKGSDLLTRIPAGNEYEILPMNLGDRVLVVLSQFRQAGREVGREIKEVEKLSLYYVALNSRLANARQLHELAVRAIERLPTSEDRIKYDHLFGAGDPENKAFWMQSLPAAAELANRFVTLED